MADTNAKESSKSFWSKVAFLTSVTGIAAIGGFSSAIAYARKKDPKNFDAALLPNEGGRLAARALLIGSALSIGGVGVICFVGYKLLGQFESKQHMKEKFASVLPEVKKKPVEERGRSNFQSFRELFDYLQESDQKRKNESTAEEKLSPTSAL